jgi:hypothetical protein
VESIARAGVPIGADDARLGLLACSTPGYPRRMATQEANRRRLRKTLARDEVQQRIVRIPARAGLFPEPGVLFDLWNDGLPWAAKIRSEPCLCGRPAAPHRHRYVECGELHAGLHWRAGARLEFVRGDDDRIVVSGDVDP